MELSSHLARSRRRLSRLLLFLSFTLAVMPITSQTRELGVAAAADLQPVFPALAFAYEQATGVKLVASFGSSATLTQQLLNGGPQDVFLSADFDHPQQLAAAGLGEGTPTPYARGILVLWARNDSPAQPLSSPGAGDTSATRNTTEATADITAAALRHILLKPAVGRIAIANPTHAPYGAAAQAAIRSLSLTDALAPKLVTAENIAQTAQFALTGNAQAAFISLTLANSAPFRAAGTFLLIPPLYPTILQAGVVLKRSPNLEAARAFLHWLTSPDTQGRLHALGLEPAH